MELDKDENISSNVESICDLAKHSSKRVNDFLSSMSFKGFADLDALQGQLLTSKIFGHRCSRFSQHRKKKWSTTARYGMMLKEET